MTGINTIAQKHVATTITHIHLIIYLICFGANEEYWYYLQRALDNDADKYLP